MRKFIYFFMSLFLVACGSSNTTDVSMDTTGEVAASAVTVHSVLSNMEKGIYKERELLVKFKSGTVTTSSVRAHQAVGASFEKRFTLVPGLEHVKLPQELSVRDAIVQYMSDPDVEYAEPNYLLRPASRRPDDTYFGQQWSLENLGAFANGTPGADIQATDAWEIHTGDTGMIIAVLDTGIQYNHPDLVGNIWTNSGETSCTDGVDNDGNGYTDDCSGYDFLNNDNDPMDDIGHGTHVAGTVGAWGNNGSGVCGVMWRVRLMALKACCDANGFFTTDAIVQGIGYAASKGAKVINASFGGTVFQQTILNAISLANNAGVLFVAAAGNEGQNNDLTPHYPSSYDRGNIIAVAATDQNDRRAAFSNYGPNSVDVAAPGVYIFSTIPTDASYGILDFMPGTSMATPHVSGLAGLLWSYYTDFNLSQIRSLILNYAENLDTLNGWINTGGRINAYRALSSLAKPSNLTATPVSSSEISLSWEDNAADEDGYVIEQKVSGGSFAAVATTGPDSETHSVSGLSPSTTYTYRVAASNTIGNSYGPDTASAATFADVTDTPSEGEGSHGGGGCSIGARQNSPTAIVSIAILLTPLLFIAIMRRRR